VPRIAITGHLNLSPQSVPIVRRAVAELLARHDADGLTGISCLARGADSLFAEAVPDRGSTSSAVADARSGGIPVHVIWPDGAVRH
jgi:hypothetical protein